VDLSVARMSVETKVEVESSEEEGQIVDDEEEDEKGVKSPLGSAKDER